ncbi:MAG: DNA translocase FtsK 4TM domain-containing protein [Clostridia bacterium]|nr:DNA translocase FtsK 4TM domain-containing protein [Clostridia bacterium]
MAKKNGGNSKQQSRQQTKKTAKRQVYAIIWLAVAVLWACIVFIRGENVWTWIHNFMFSMFGITAYVFPILLGFAAIMVASDKMSRAVKVRTIETVVLSVLVGSMIDVFANYNQDLIFGDHISGIYAAGESVATAIKGGGVLGTLISHPVCAAFGKTGAAITFILVIFVLLMLMTGTTLIMLFKALGKPAKAVGEQVENTFATRAEKKENELKVVKGFNVDIPVDGEKERKSKKADKNETLEDKQKKLVATYNGEEIPEEQTSIDIDSALVSAENAEENQSGEPEKIKVDFEKETEEMGNRIKENYIKNVGYIPPPLTLLNEYNSGDTGATVAEQESVSERLVETLRSFGVETRVVDISRGPTVTRYELQPKAGVKISKITSLANDIALNLATAGVRIEAPIPNKAAVGIEVPNRQSAVVGVREIIESTAFSASKSTLTVSMGRDLGGNVVVTDIAKMPHGLIAGATGSGKSVCINSFIISILYKASPDDVKLLMIDPKVVELNVYNGIPHLLVPVVTDPRKAAGALGWAVSEMEKRYHMFADRGVRDINGYNKFVENLKDEPEVTKLPQIVIIVDELADLMMTAPKEVEDSINRIAAKARAAGMHLLIATQRPSVDVVTGVIKANIPTRIAFSVSSQIDSRTILDSAGAEKLLGRGDMLFDPIGSTKPRRLQGCFVSEEEVERVVEYVKKSANADYDSDIADEIERHAPQDKQKGGAQPMADDEEGDADAMLDDAIRVVVEAGQASTSLLQRRLKLGYSRAARIIDQMEERGIVGPYEGSKPRKVLITKDELMEREAQSE